MIWNQCLVIKNPWFPKGSLFLYFTLYVYKVAGNFVTESTLGYSEPVHTGLFSPVHSGQDYSHRQSGTGYFV